jgi:predicted transcriptional regulator
MITRPRHRPRDSHRICADILSVARKGARKTHILYDANLSYGMLNRYLERLTKAGLLVINCSDTYITTEKGFIYLKEYKGLVRCGEEYRVRNCDLYSRFLGKNQEFVQLSEQPLIL